MTDRDMAQKYWEKANLSVRTARKCLPEDPPSAASRAYYAAFYAVSALFLLEGRRFSKHTAVAMAVHRDLVLTGAWAPKLAARFDELARMRHVSDYLPTESVNPSDATNAIEWAVEVLGAVAKLRPTVFFLE